MGTGDPILLSFAVIIRHLGTAIYKLPTFLKSEYGIKLCCQHRNNSQDKDLSTIVWIYFTLIRGFY